MHDTAGIFRQKAFEMAAAVILLGAYVLNHLSHTDAICHRRRAAMDEFPAVIDADAA
jgi:hypothetical protein